MNAVLFTKERGIAMNDADRLNLQQRLQEEIMLLDVFVDRLREPVFLE